MMSSKLSESRRASNRRWDEKNKERKAYINKRSVARNFIKTMDDVDIPEFELLIKERKEKAERVLEDSSKTE